MIVVPEHWWQRQIGSHVHCGTVVAQETRSRQMVMYIHDSPYVLNMSHEKDLTLHDIDIVTCCRDKQSERQDEGQRSRPSKHDRGGLRPSDRDASGSGQWHRSGELDEQDWDNSRDREHDTYR